MARLIRPAMMVMLAAVLLANAALLAGIVITREPAPRPLNGERILAASRPAIVLIQGNFDVTASLPNTTIPGAKAELLINRVIDQIRSRKIPATEAAATQAAINLLLSNPEAYFEPGAVETYHFHLVSSGTGFFVTEDGYLVTAAHVVSADKEELRAEVLGLFKKPDMIEAGRKAIQSQFANATNISLTSAQVDSLMSFYQRWLNKYLTVPKVEARYYLGTGAVEAGERLASSGARATVVSVDPTDKGHDIAIMKAAVNGVPTLALSSAAPSVGKDTYAIGYPRQGYLQEEASINATVKLTMTTGKVMTSESKTGGWSAYGTDAHFTHGDSGGPVLDSDGQVMGVISYSSVDESGQQVKGGGFFVPAQYVTNLADPMINGNSGRTAITNIYYHALAEGDIQRYKTELVLLGQVQSRSTWAGYVKDDITTVQSQILSGKDRTPPEFANYAPASAASAVLAILIAVSAWVTVRILKGRRLRALPSAPIGTTVQTVEEPRVEVHVGEPVMSPMASTENGGPPHVLADPLGVRTDGLSR
jgi:S1-C subfamily serine protease